LKHEGRDGSCLVGIFFLFELHSGQDDILQYVFLHEHDAEYNPVYFALTLVWQLTLSARSISGCNAA
jgi:hypothetical protein